jgi:hypothetical protein
MRDGSEDDDGGDGVDEEVVVIVSSGTVFGFYRIFIWYTEYLVLGTVCFVVWHSFILDIAVFCVPDMSHV